MYYITDSLDYYLGNELFKVWNKIHVPSNKYSGEILQMYQQKHGDLKKELLSLKLKENPELDKTPLLE